MPEAAIHKDRQPHFGKNEIRLAENRLKESAEYELCGIVEQRPGVLEELTAERVKLLEKESTELEREAEKLAEEIKELSGEAEASRIG